MRYSNYIREKEHLLNTYPFACGDFRRTPKDKLESLKLELENLGSKKERLKEREKEIKKQIRTLVKELQKE